MMRYATPCAASEDADRINRADYISEVPLWLRVHVLAIVRDTRASSDVLLITADALRDDAPYPPDSRFYRAFHALADALAALAPTRANPVA